MPIYIDSYWSLRKDREDEIKASDKYVSDFLVKSSKMYGKALIDIENLIKDMYLKYGSNGKVDFNRLAGIDEKRRLTRLEAMKIDINNRLNKLYKDVRKPLSKNMADAFEDSYYHTKFDTQRRAGFGGSFGMLPDGQIKKYLETPWMDGKNFSDRLWQDKQKLLYNLEQTLGQGISLGWSNDQMAKAIKESMESSFSSAQRLVRTEINHISNDAAAKAYQSEGVEYYEFVATLDDRTSEICQLLDGKIFPLKEKQEGVNAPPMHPNCRSTIIPVIETSADLSSGLGEFGVSKRDEKTGDINEVVIKKGRVMTELRTSKVDKQRYLVPQDMSYENWKRQYVDHKQPLGMKDVEDFLRTPKIEELKRGDGVTFNIDSNQLQLVSTYLFNESLEREGQLTRNIIDIAQENGVSTAQLVSRTKSLSSITTKVKNDFAASRETKDKGNKSLKDFADTVADTNRYSMILGDNNFVTKYTDIVNSMEKKGYTLVRVKNFFTKEGSTYKGINTTFLDNNGKAIELQFHTEASYKVKTFDNHALYKKLTDTLETAEVKKKALEQSLENIAKVPLPKDVDTIAPYNESKDVEELRKEKGFAAPSNSWELEKKPDPTKPIVVPIETASGNISKYQSTEELDLIFNTAQFINKFEKMTDAEKAALSETFSYFLKSQTRRLSETRLEKDLKSLVSDGPFSSRYVDLIKSYGPLYEVYKERLIANKQKYDELRAMQPNAVSTTAQYKENVERLRRDYLTDGDEWRVDTKKVPEYKVDRDERFGLLNINKGHTKVRDGVHTEDKGLMKIDDIYKVDTNVIPQLLDSYTNVNEPVYFEGLPSPVALSDVNSAIRPVEFAITVVKVDGKYFARNATDSTKLLILKARGFEDVPIKVVDMDKIKKEERDADIPAFVPKRIDKFNDEMEKHNLVDKYVDDKMKITLLEKTKAILNESKVATRVAFGDVASILSDALGNQLEVGTSAGCYYPELRRQMTNVLFGNVFSGSEIRDTDHEKYGYIAPADLKRDFERGMRGPNQYGDCRLTFKDTIKERTTFCMGDSLDSYGSIAPSRLNEPKVTSIIPSGTVSLTSLSRNADFLADNINNGTLEKAKDIVDLQDALSSIVQYTEAQIFGKVLPEHIESVTLGPKVEVEDHPDLFENIKQLCEENGIKLYRMDRWREPDDEGAFSDVTKLWEWVPGEGWMFVDE